jgi:ferredoxin-type protein NapH
MATNVHPLPLAGPGQRGVGRSILLTVPIMLWSLLIFVDPQAHHDFKSNISGGITAIFMIAMFFMMMRTGTTYRWRRWFFVSVGVLFPIEFIHQIMVTRGTMGIPIEEMIAGRTPFCFLPTPLLILPAALTRTIIFPGSILPGKGMAGGGIAAMIGIWLAITLVIGKGWCSYACFFGGIEEGVAAIPKRAKIRKFDPRWHYLPWAVLLAMVLLSLALFEPAYCMWLCPFKAVSEYVAARNTVGLIQNVIFVVLFAALVFVLPFLTKKRTQCSFLCPFGAFPISVQQDQRFRRKDRQGEVPQLRSLPECVSQHVADQGVDCQGRSVDVVYEMRRMRGCVCAAGGLVAHKRDRCWMEA